MISAGSTSFSMVEQDACSMLGPLPSQPMAAGTARLRDMPQYAKP